MCSCSFASVLRCDVFQVEEIEDIDGSSSDPFIADAIENEKELILSEEQRKNYRKVCPYCFAPRLYLSFPVVSDKCLDMESIIFF